jgi:hypothetical protein
MSDTSILPTAAVGAPPTGPSGPDFGEEPTDDRRRLLIIGGAVAVVLVVIVGFLLLRGGSSDSDLGAVPRGTPHSGSAPEPSATSGSGHKAGATLPKKSHRNLARDPFKPLIAAQTAGGTTTGDTTTGDTTTGITSGDGATTTTDGGAPSASLGAPVAIRLISVNGVKGALFEVSYAHHKALRYNVLAPSAGSATGTVFGSQFALLGVQGKSVTLQVGDDTPFDLRRGASHSL